MVIFSIKKEAIDKLSIGEIHSLLNKWIENGYLLHDGIFDEIKKRSATDHSQKNSEYVLIIPSMLVI